MISKNNIFIYFIDNDDSYIRDIINTLEEVNKYSVKIFSKSCDFFKEFSELKFHSKKVFIVFVSTELEFDEDNNQIEVLDVLKKIKQINNSVEVILYSNDDNINVVSSAFHHGVYTFIKKNENIVVRIENNIKGIISQKAYLLKRNASRKFTLFFLIFVAGSAVLFLIFFYLFPSWFRL